MLAPEHGLPDSTTVRNKFLLLTGPQSVVFCYSSWNQLKTRIKYEDAGTIIAESGRKRHIVKIGGSFIEDGHLQCLSSGGRMKMPFWFCVSCSYSLTQSA